MRPVYRLPLQCALLLLTSFSAFTFAGTVQRCEDASGNITFTAHGCPADQASETRKVHNPLPGSIAPAAAENPAGETKTRTAPDKELVVVGQRDDGCGNRLTPEARRSAIMNGRVLPGMTIQEVENLLGRPTKTLHRNGDLRYQYEDKKKKLTHLVTFDSDGCVQGKR